MCIRDRFQMMRDHGVTEEFLRAGNFEAREGEPFEAVLHRLPDDAFEGGQRRPTEYQQDFVREVVNKLKQTAPEQVPRFLQGVWDHVGPRTPYTEEERARLNPHQRALLRSMESREGSEPRLADDYIRGLDRQDGWTTSDLGESYDALMRAGREEEARQILSIVGGAMDVGRFIERSDDAPPMVEARMREAVKKHHTPEELSHIHI